MGRCALTEPTHLPGQVSTARGRACPHSPARPAPHLPAVPARHPAGPRRNGTIPIGAGQALQAGPRQPRTAHSSGALPATPRRPNPTRLTPRTRSGPREPLPPQPPPWLGLPRAARPAAGPRPKNGGGNRAPRAPRPPRPAPSAQPRSPSSRRLAPRPRAPPLVSPRPPGPGSRHRRLTIPRRGRPPSSCPHQRQGRRTRPTSRRSAAGRPRAVRRRTEECARCFREPPAAPPSAPARPEVGRPSEPTRAAGSAKRRARARGLPASLRRAGASCGAQRGASVLPLPSAPLVFLLSDRSSRKNTRARVSEMKMPRSCVHGNRPRGNVSYSRSCAWGAFPAPKGAAGICQRNARCCLASGYLSCDYLDPATVVVVNVVCWLSKN